MGTDILNPGLCIARVPASSTPIDRLQPAKSALRIAATLPSSPCVAMGAPRLAETPLDEISQMAPPNHRKRYHNRASIESMAIHPGLADWVGPRGASVTKNRPRPRLLVGKIPQSPLADGAFIDVFARMLLFVPPGYRGIEPPSARLLFMLYSFGLFVGLAYDLIYWRLGRSYVRIRSFGKC